MLNVGRLAPRPLLAARISVPPAGRPVRTPRDEPGRSRPAGRGRPRRPRAGESPGSRRHRRRPRPAAPRGPERRDRGHRRRESLPATDPLPHRRLRSTPARPGRTRAGRPGRPGRRALPRRRRRLPSLGGGHPAAPSPRAPGLAPAPGRRRRGAVARPSLAGWIRAPCLDGRSRSARTGQVASSSTHGADRFISPTAGACLPGRAVCAASTRSPATSWRWPGRDRDRSPPCCSTRAI